MRKVHQSYYCLSYFRPPTSVEVVSLSGPSHIISPAATQQNYLEVLNRFHEQCQPETNLPTDNENQDVQEAVSLLAMLRNSGM